MTDSQRLAPDEMVLRHGGFVRALARALLADAQSGDDVAQSTWVAALEHGPQRLARPRAWLREVVRNLARRTRRSAARQQRREHAAARPEALPPASEACEREEILRAVTAAVLALDEPYRQAILLRYYEGLDARAIATRQGVPLATVRSRLQRALARLRTELDRTHGGDPRAWGGALLGLLGMRPARSTSVGSVTAAAGAMTVNTYGKLVVAAAVGAVVLVDGAFGVRAVLRTPTAPEIAAKPMRAEVAAEPAAARAADAVRQPIDEPAPEAPPAPPVLGPVEVPPWLARFRVTDEQQQPIAGAVVTMWAAKRKARSSHFPGRGNVYSGREDPVRQRVTTDAEGVAQATLDLECVVAEASAPGLGPSGEATLWHTHADDETHFVLQPPFALRGVVLRADGSPAAAARVVVRPPGAIVGGVQPPVPEPGTTDAEGRFAVTLSWVFDYRVYAELDGQRTLPLDVTVHDRHPADLVLAFPGAITLEGEVIDADGHPVPDALVQAWREFHPSDRDQDPDQGEHVQGRADERGRFSIPVRAHARYQVVAAAKGQAPNAPVWLETTAAQPHPEARIALQSYSAIAGRVVSADGEPRAGIRITAWPESDQPVFLVAVPSRFDLFPKPFPVTTGADGRFRLPVQRGVTWTLSATRADGDARAGIRAAGIEPGRNDVVLVMTEADLAGCTVHGTVTRPDGQPVGAYRVEVVDVDADVPTANGPEAAIDGAHFTLPPLPLGRRFEVRVTPCDDAQTPANHGPFAPVQVGPFTTDRARLDLELSLQRWAELPVRVLHHDGSPAVGCRVTIASDDGGHYVTAGDVDGRGDVDLRRCLPHASTLAVLEGPPLAGHRIHEQAITLAPGPNPQVVIRLPVPSDAKTR